MSASSDRTRKAATRSASGCDQPGDGGEHAAEVRPAAGVSVAGPGDLFLTGPGHVTLDAAALVARGKLGLGDGEE